MIDATHRFYVDDEEVQPRSDINILRRRMFSKFALEVKAGQTVVLEKFSNVYTNRDRELENYTHHQMQAYALKALQEDEAAGFDALLAESAACWKENSWIGGGWFPPTALLSWWLMFPTWLPLWSGWV